MRAWFTLLSAMLPGLAPLAAMAALPDGCGPLVDPERIARTAPIILVGEIHGTREYPALVARLACDALAGGRAVTLALEIPLEEEARLAAYVASNGDTRASAALTAGSWFWRELRDGRASGAMLLLVEQARRWRAQGKPIRLIAIDKPRGAPGTRDEHMAARVRQASLARPGALVIALTGNLHNQLVPPSFHVPVDTPMGVLLRDLGPVSVGSPMGRGEFFGCSPDCRVHGRDEPGQPLAAPVIASARDRGRGPHTHEVELGRTTASLPAGDQLR